MHQVHNNIRYILEYLGIYVPCQCLGAFTGKSFPYVPSSVDRIQIKSSAPQLESGGIYLNYLVPGRLAR